MSFLEKDKQLNIFCDQLFNIYINWMNRKKFRQNINFIPNI